MHFVKNYLTQIYEKKEARGLKITVLHFVNFSKFKGKNFLFENYIKKNHQKSLIYVKV